LPAETPGESDEDDESDESDPEPNENPSRRRTEAAPATT
jgi:hypothetical protein